MANVLILYATTYGQTARIARELARGIEAHGRQVTLRPIADSPPAPELAGFDAVIVGAPVYQNRHPRAIRAFARRHRRLLNQKPSAFFSVSGLAASARPQDQAAARRVVARFFVATGWHPPRVAIFAGAIPYTRYDPLTRLLIRWFMARQGSDTDTRRDYEYTDWDAVIAFVEDIAREAEGRSRE